jgi:chromosomal replication initiation ATPase DnaA
MSLKKVAGYYCINPDDLKTASKESTLTKARTVLCYFAVRRLKISCADVARKSRISPATVSRAASRGADLPDLKQIQRELLGC